MIRHFCSPDSEVLSDDDDDVMILDCVGDDCPFFFFFFFSVFFMLSRQRGIWYEGSIGKVSRSQ